MKTIRLLLLLLITAIGFAAPAASAAPAAASDEERLIGTWEEYEPSSNVIQFSPDHTIKLYLTEEEGEDADPPLHYIGGTWSLSSGGVLTMHMSANGKEITRSVKVVFRIDDMVMVDDAADDGETVHRRLKGALPAKYSW